MELCEARSQEFCIAAGEEGQKKWAQEHANRLQHLFEQWQKPLGIDSGDYGLYLKEELSGYYDKPLLRSFIESLT